MNASTGKYFVKNTSAGTYVDMTTQFNGLAITKVDGLNEKGEPVNIYTAQWVNSQVEDMMITIGLNKSKIGGKDITAKSEIAVSTPNYLSGNANRTDAKFKYRFDINGKLYRYAYDTLGKHWFFIPVQ